MDVSSFAFCSTRLQDSLMINDYLGNEMINFLAFLHGYSDFGNMHLSLLCKYHRNESINFLHGDNHKEKVASKITSFDLVWPVVSLAQSDSRKKNQYLCFFVVLFRIEALAREGSILASDTTTFGLVWPFLSFFQSHQRIFWSLLLFRTNW